MEVAQPAVPGNRKVRDREVADCRGPAGGLPASSATPGAAPQDIDGARKGSPELALELPMSRQSGALARRDRTGQTLGDFVDAPLVRSPCAVFVAYGALNLPGFGRVFYVILSDAPLDQDPKWVLILIWTSRSDIPEAADCARVGLNARAAPRPLGEAPALLPCPAVNVTC